jgi:hypothetical protein
VPVRIPAVPTVAAGVTLVLGVMPVTENVTRCETAAPCPSVHTVVVLPERIVSALVLAALAYAVASVLTRLVRATHKAAPPEAADSRALTSLVCAVLLLPASWTVGFAADHIWESAPRTSGWANLPIGILAGVLVAGVLLNCALAPWLRTPRATADSDPSWPRPAR